MGIPPWPLAPGPRLRRGTGGRGRPRGPPGLYSRLPGGTLPTIDVATHVARRVAQTGAGTAPGDLSPLITFLIKNSTPLSPKPLLGPIVTLISAPVGSPSGAVLEPRGRGRAPRTTAGGPPGPRGAGGPGRKPGFGAGLQGPRPGARGSKFKKVAIAGPRARGMGSEPGAWARGPRPKARGPRPRDPGPGLGHGARKARILDRGRREQTSSPREPRAWDPESQNPRQGSQGTVFSSTGVAGNSFSLDKGRWEHDFPR